MLLIAPLSGIVFDVGWTAVLAMFLVQITMAVTLAATFVSMPNHPGTAFGLPSLALLLGTIPGVTGLSAKSHPALLLLVTVLACTMMLFFGLGFVAVRRCQVKG
jgi:hypothetical protein